MTACQRQGTPDEYSMAVRYYRLLQPRQYQRMLSMLLPGVATASDGGETASASSAAQASTPQQPVPSKGKGKGKQQPEEKRLVEISKALTSVLRHRAINLKLDIRPDGFLPVPVVLELQLIKKLKCSQTDLEQIVRESDKQRFALTDIDGVKHIRATQGHSMKVIQDELLLEKLELGSGNLPADVVHGTFLRHWDSISKDGLLAGGKMGPQHRNHVHFATGLPDDGEVISGMRQSADLAIYLDLRRALAAGLPVFRSANGVILSPGFDGVVPPDLFLRAVRLKDSTTLWPASETVKGKL
eukprot:gnl/TRDRNA2_/TRDRNA2_195741_c0_seq1.p1 gnl/TRDRNA2_/TRDRNA2_195741_c0~~gnl/TRDRNA2_/TRDRNA2_195741_c0_seq1.p1  ORF type:complete len:299 (+),score=47.59 gnl/TRDRNA2_/TRDRNA2_195741_c0_seq1:62-958(+)